MSAIEVVLIIIGVILMLGSFFVSEKLSQKEVEEISKLSSNELKTILAKNIKSAEPKVEELVDNLIDRSMEIADRALEKETNMKIQNISEFSESVLESIHKNHSEVMFLYSMLNEKHTELTNVAGKLGKLKSEMVTLEEEINNSNMEANDFVQKISEQMSEIQMSISHLETIQRDASQRLASQRISSQMVTTKKKSSKDNVSQRTERKAETPQVSLELEDELLKYEQETLYAETEDFTEEADINLMNNNQNILSLYQEGLTVREIARKLGLGIGEVKLVLELYREVEA